jgi:hypothetical protein
MIEIRSPIHLRLGLLYREAEKSVRGTTGRKFRQVIPRRLHDLAEY